jgi:hypothetical protein
MDEQINDTANKMIDLIDVLFGGHFIFDAENTGKKPS